MNIGELRVALGVDPKGLTEGRRALQQFVNQVAADQKRATEALGARGGVAVTQAVVAAQESIKAITREFERSSGAAKEAMVRGLIDQRTFATAGTDAAQAFNASILGEIDKLRATGTAAQPMIDELVSQLKVGGERAAGEFTQSFEQRMKALGTNLSSVGTRLSVAITTPLLAIAGFGVKQATEAATIARRFGSAFGEEATRIERQLGLLQTRAHATDDELKGMAVSVQQLSTSLGFGQAQAANMSTELIRVAAAVAKVKGNTTANVLDAFRNGLAGSTRGLKEFDIVLDDSAIKQEALRLGILGQGQELTAAGKAWVTYKLILSQTTDVVAKAGTLAETPAERFRDMANAAKEAAQRLGTALLPTLTSVADVATRVLGAVTKLDPTLVHLGIALGGVAAATGPVLFGLGQMLGLVTSLAKAAQLAAGAAGLGALTTSIGILGGVLAIGGVAILAGSLREAAINAELARENLDALGKKIDGIRQLSGVEGLKTELANIERFMGVLSRERDRLLSLGQPQRADAGLGDPRAFKARVEEIERSIAGLRDQAKAFQDALAAPPSTFDNILDGLKGLLAFNVASPLEEAQQRAQGLLASYEQLRGPTGVVAELWNQMKESQQEISKLLAAQPSQFTQTAAQLRAIKRELEGITSGLGPEQLQRIFANLSSLRPSNITTFPAPRPVIDGAKQQLDVAVRDFRLAARTLDLAIGTGSKEVAKQAEEDMKRLQARARELGALVIAALSGDDVKPADREKGLERVRDILKEMGLIAAKPTTEISKLESQLQALHQTGTVALSAITSGFAGLDRNISRTLSSTLSLVSSLQLAVHQARAVGKETNTDGTAKGTLASIGDFAGLAGAIAGIVGAASSIANALFGQSESEKEIAAALKANAEEIARASLELTGALKSARNIAQAGNAARILAAAGIPTSKPLENSGVTAGSFQFVLKTLRDLGVSLGELNAIAEDNGIQLLDSEGRIIAGAFAQIAERLGITEDALTRWGASLDAQRNKLDLRALVAGIDRSPIQRITEELGLLVGADSPLKNLFKGLNADTAQGRTQIRAALANILGLIDANKLTIEHLGTLTGIDDLTSIIRNVATALNEMDQKTRDLTESLTNVPQGFKVALARFNATAPVSSVTSTTALPGSTGMSVVFQAGSIVQQPGEDGEALANRVVRTLEQRSRRTYGTPVNWARVS